MKRSLLVTMCVLAASVVSVQMTTAYMTDRPHHVQNVFTMGDIDIELKEDNWKETQADTVHPLQNIAKDPVVANNGSLPAYVFLEVQIPVKTIRTVDENGRKTEAARHELFTFMYDSARWSLIRKENQADSTY